MSPELSTWTGTLKIQVRGWCNVSTCAPSTTPVRREAAKPREVGVKTVTPS